MYIQPPLVKYTKVSNRRLIKLPKTLSVDALMV